MLVKQCYENNIRSVLLILSITSGKLPVTPALLSWEVRQPKRQRKREMCREFEQGKVKQRLKGKQGAVGKECFAVDLWKMGAVELGSFPRSRQTNTNHMFVIWA